MSLRWHLLLVFLFSAALLAAQTVPHSKHVWLIAEENHSYENVLKSMPYLVSLGNQYGVATQYYSDMHNSLSALMHLTAGETVTTDDNTKLTFNVDNIVRQMLAAGLMFKSYQEGLPYAGYLGITSGRYYKRHNPLAYFSDVADSSLKYNIVPYSQLATDMGDHLTANFNYVTPNMDDDAHDGSMASADAWLAANVPAILQQPEFQPGGDGILFIVFDEGNLSTDNRCSATVPKYCGGRIFTAVIGPNVKPAFQSTTWYNHESLLKTVCLALGTPSCPGAAETATPMSDFFIPPSVKVQLSAPADGGTVLTTLQVSAKGTSTAAITGWWIYVDGVKTWHGAASNSISQKITVTPGQHTLMVRAWAGTPYGTATAKINALPPGVTVTVSSPTPDQKAIKVGSQVHFAATAVSVNRITGWVIYLDSHNVYSGKATKLDTTLSVPTGNHQVMVRAWDNSGAFGSSYLALTR